MKNSNLMVDLLRGCSIIIVFLLHFHLSYNLDLNFKYSKFYNFFIDSFVRNGNYGVTIFFTISGFLITSTSIKRYTSLENINIKNFYVTRFARIFPPLLLALIIITALSLLGRPSFINSDGAHSYSISFLILSIFSVLTFWHNILMTYYNYFNYSLNIYWSLSVEEVFYLFFPLFFSIIKNKKTIYSTIIVLIITGLIFRYFHQDNEIYFMYHYFACFDAISIGCLTAILYNKKNNFKYMKLFQILFIAIIAINFIVGIGNNKIFGFFFISVGAAGLIFISKNICDDWISKNRLTRIICHFGKYSYELYLFHIIILGILRDAIKPEQLSSVSKLCLLIAFIAVSFFTSKYISKFYSEKLNKVIRYKFGNRNFLEVKDGINCKPEERFSGTKEK